MEIASFEEVIESAEYSILEKPTYDLLIQYDDGNTHGLHLILGMMVKRAK